MIDGAWQWVMLRSRPLAQWQRASLLHRWVGLCGPWRASSWLLQWWDALGAILIALVLGFAPFASTTLVGVLLLLCGGFWVVLTVSDNQSSRVTPIHWAVLVYWSLLVIAAAFSPAKSLAFSGLFKFSVCIALFFLGAEVLQRPRWRNWLITLYLHISLVVAGYGIRQEYHGVEQLATWNDPESILAQNTRVYSFLGNPNLLSSYLIPAIALSLAALFVWRGRLPKVLAGVTLIVNLACLYFTDSRGGWLATLVMLGVLLLLGRYWFAEFMPRFWRRWLLPLIFGTGAAAVTGAILTVETIRVRFFSIFAGREDSSNNYRINVWEAVWQMVADHPVFGIGPGNEVFKKLYPLYARAGYDNALGAYSVFFEHIVEVGWVGFLGFLWLLTIALGYGLHVLGQFRSRREPQAFWLMAAIAAGVGLLAQGLFDTVWYRPAVNTLWWFLVAIVASFVPEPSTALKTAE